jgi:hypothetical protein
VVQGFASGVNAWLLWNKSGLSQKKNPPKRKGNHPDRAVAGIMV